MKFEELSLTSEPLIKTPIPGEKSEYLLKMQADAEGKIVSYPKGTPIAIKEAKGATIVDLDGNIFLDFYHMLTCALKEAGIARNVWAVNLDGAIASVVLGIYWESLKNKSITVQRVRDMAFMIFALGRVAGAGGEFLSHQDFGSPMDMRIPVKECISITRAKD